MFFKNFNSNFFTSYVMCTEFDLAKRSFTDCFPDKIVSDTFTFVFFSFFSTFVSRLSVMSIFACWSSYLNLIFVINRAYTLYLLDRSNLYISYFGARLLFRIIIPVWSHFIIVVWDWTKRSHDFGLSGRILWLLFISANIGEWIDLEAALF